MLGSIILTSFISASFIGAFSHGVLYTALLCVFIWVCFNVRHMRLPGVAVCAAVLFFVCRSRRDAFVAQLGRICSTRSAGSTSTTFTILPRSMFSRNLTDDQITGDARDLGLYRDINGHRVERGERKNFFLPHRVGRLFCRGAICVNGFPPVYASVGIVLFWVRRSSPAAHIPQIPEAGAPR